MLDPTTIPCLSWRGQPPPAGPPFKPRRNPTTYHLRGDLDAAEVLLGAVLTLQLPLLVIVQEAPQLHVMLVAPSRGHGPAGKLCVNGMGRPGCTPNLPTSTVQVPQLGLEEMPSSISWAPHQDGARQLSWPQADVTAVPHHHHAGHLWPPQPSGNSTTQLLSCSTEQRPSLLEQHQMVINIKGTSWHPSTPILTLHQSWHHRRVRAPTGHPSGCYSTALGDALVPKLLHSGLILLYEYRLLSQAHGVRQVHHLFPAGAAPVEASNKGKNGSVLSVPRCYCRSLE